MDSSERRYHVTYTGSDVVRLGKAGLFMPGTSAYVTEEDADEAKALGVFKIEKVNGGPAVPEAHAAPAAPAKPEPPKAEVKAEAKPEPPKTEAKPDAKDAKHEGKDAKHEHKDEHKDAKEAEAKKEEPKK